MESCSEEVDISFMEIWQCCQKSRLVFDFCILLTVIQKKVGIDEGNGNKSWVCTVFPCNSSWCDCHAQLSTEITICLEYDWCLLISKVDIGMLGQYFWISRFLA